MSGRLLFSVSLISAAWIAHGAALADPPADRCQDTPFGEFGSPGDVNKDLFSPGQVQKADEDFSASAVAKENNEVRKDTCPPPGQTK
jgi:hypothetical protein